MYLADRVPSRLFESVLALAKSTIGNYLVPNFPSPVTLHGAAAADAARTVLWVGAISWRGLQVSEWSFSSTHGLVEGKQRKHCLHAGLGSTCVTRWHAY